MRSRLRLTHCSKNLMAVSSHWTGEIFGRCHMAMQCRLSRGRCVFATVSSKSISRAGGQQASSPFNHCCSQTLILGSACAWQPCAAA